MSGRWFLLAAGLLLAACTVEPAQPEPDGKMTLVAGIDGTKVTFDNYKLAWESTDKMFVIEDNKGTSAVFSYKEDVSGGKARFEGNNLASEGPYRAVWPTEAVSYANSDEFVVYFYREQTIPARGVSKYHMFLYGEGGGELHFRPAVGLLKFTVKRSDVKRIRFSTVKAHFIAIDSETTNGASVDLDGNLVLHYSRTDYMSILPEEGDFVAGEPYYIAFPPGVYDGGLVINLVNEADQEAIKFSYNDLTVQAGKVTNLGELDAEFAKDGLPQYIECDSPIGNYSYSSENYPYGLSIDDVFDLGSLVSVYPSKADQTVAYVSMDERLKVTADGVVSATEPVLAGVKVYAVANPDCYRFVYFDFGGLKQNGIYFRIDAERNFAYVTNSSFSTDPVDDSYSGTVTVPASVSYGGKDYPVKTVLENAFSRCSNLVKVVLPEGLDCILPYAFNDCPLLEEVNIPSTLKDMMDVSSNSFANNCPKLSFTSASTIFPVDEYGNLYDEDYKKELVWLCEKTTGVNAIKEGITQIGSGDGPLHESMATAIKFPASLRYEIWVNAFRGDFPNIKEIIVDFPTYEEFERVFKHFRKDSSHEYVAGIFSRLRNHNSDSPSAVKLSVPAAYVSEYSSAVADYGFAAVVTH